MIYFRDAMNLLNVCLLVSYWPFGVKLGGVFPVPRIPVDTVDRERDVRTFGNGVSLNNYVILCKTIGSGWNKNDLM